MPLTVVGSIAFDAVKTPLGERARMLGGSAVHFALAASFFDDVRVVGPVGDDFGPSEYAVLHARGVQTEDIEHVPGGRTFFWRGEYGPDPNTRETLETQLGVFADFVPKLSAASRSADVLFLANIQPALQREVREQCPDARFVALDSMNLWIDTARDSLIEALRRVDCAILNEDELRMLTGDVDVVPAARRVMTWGPRAVVVKRGEHGAALITDGPFFALPAYPVARVLDPTGAGDSFAGGFMGAIAAGGHGDVSAELLRRAVAYGTALASFNVEEFGTERIARLKADEITARVDGLRTITRFDDVAVPLRR